MGSRLRAPSRSIAAVDYRPPPVYDIESVTTHCCSTVGGRASRGARQVEQQWVLSKIDYDVENFDQLEGAENERVRALRHGTVPAGWEGRTRSLSA